MDAFKRFSLALMAAVVVAGATPAFSQTRDTRPTEPDRPTIEQGEKGGSEERADRAQPGRLPKGTPGTECKLAWDGDQISGVLLTNDTGKMIPVGTVITVYIQPGNIQKQYKVTADWHPGTVVDIAIDVGSVTSIAACSMKVQPDRSGQLPQPEPEKPWYMQGEVSFYCTVVWRWDPPPGRPFVSFKNDGDVMIPAGTTITYMLPLGEAVSYVLEKDWHPGQYLEVAMHYSLEMQEFYIIHDKEHQACSNETVVTGDYGPAVEEQGPVPGIDPAKVP
ncbi:hypothetical protein ASC89_15650 [Devosia sp. Root413D1]|uniref:hypothetical protein n=1 Tax=Devosia sp. Root413D1 TaxID=1736531 RepID=UPI0006F279F1|nr:hypothetical protein [Devosia sp. Root413D1]KQW78223.1 hypothetical protein ASC89_15650 [Devosia sp. Root413D1]